MHCLLTLVNDNHVYNYLKEILAFVYYVLIVNNRRLGNSNEYPKHVLTKK